MHFSAVAPPRGERGLKSEVLDHSAEQDNSRSPSWGAWIEILHERQLITAHGGVAPPRGERGLKSVWVMALRLPERSLPLVGSVD